MCTEKESGKVLYSYDSIWPLGPTRRAEHRKRCYQNSKGTGRPRSSWFSLLLSPEQKRLNASILYSKLQFGIEISLSLCREFAHTLLFIHLFGWLLSQERRRKGCRECMKYLHIISFCECRARKERKRYGREQKEKRQPQVTEIKRWKNADTGTKIIYKKGDKKTIFVASDKRSTLLVLIWLSTKAEWQFNGWKRKSSVYNKKIWKK